MHADEVETDADLVRRLLRDQLPEWAGLAIEPVASSGTDNALYRLGTDMVVRLPRIHWAVAGVEKEQRWLPRLAPHLPVAVPAPLAKGEPGHGYPWPWSVYRWLEGEHPSVEDTADHPQLAADLGAFVAALHAVRLPGGPPSGRGVPLAERDGPMRAAIAAVADEVDVAAVTAAWEEALHVPRWAGPPVWTHGDLAPTNLLCAGGRLHAVIDFGGLGVGDPACDALVAWNLLAPWTREAFRTASGMDDDTWARGRGWALTIALVILPYYRDTNPTLTASARHVIAQVLADGGGT